MEHTEKTKTDWTVTAWLIGLVAVGSLFVWGVASSGGDQALSGSTGGACSGPNMNVDACADSYGEDPGIAP